MHRHGSVCHGRAAGAAPAAGSRGIRPRQPTRRRRGGPGLHPDPDRGRQGRRRSPRRSPSISGVTLAEDVTGPYDVIVRVEARNVDELGKLVIAKIQDVAGHHPHPHLHRSSTSEPRSQHSRRRAGAPTARARRRAAPSCSWPALACCCAVRVRRRGRRARGASSPACAAAAARGRRPSAASRASTPTRDRRRCAAWGDPAIIARCGVAAPGPTTDRVHRASTASTGSPQPAQRRRRASRPFGRVAGVEVLGAVGLRPRAAAAAGVRHGGRRRSRSGRRHCG